jgi:protein SCO1/2
MTSLLKRPTLAVVLTALIAACGGTGDDGVLLGYEPPSVTRTADVTVTEAGASAPFRLEASAGGILIVFFGFTNCPDVCPATLAAIKNALRKVDDDLAARVDVAMITVDPDRDTAEVLTGYVQSFVAGAHALRTDDAASLRAAADAFGASYEVATAEDGTVKVAHSAAMYVVDSSGTVTLTWPFGVKADDLRLDLEALLAEVDR